RWLRGQRRCLPPASSHRPLGRFRKRRSWLAALRWGGDRRSGRVLTRETTQDLNSFQNSGPVLVVDALTPQSALGSGSGGGRFPARVPGLPFLAYGFFSMLFWWRPG